MTDEARLLEEAQAEETAQKKKIMIDVDGVSYAYPNYEAEADDVALDSVSFRVYEGEFVALLGHNGSGKSTLAKLMNAQILPQKGSIHILGMDTAQEKNLWDIRSRCAMVFQNPDNQMVASIVEEDVAFGPENLAIPNPELRERVDRALQLTGMTDFRRRSSSQLSGGQKQRVAIAGVLAMLPACIILDEPTAMLDPIGRREIIETVHYLNQELGTTIILITHNMEEAVAADRILVLSDGKIALEGSPRQVFGQVETMQKLQLDVAQVTELSYLLHQEGFPISKDCLTIEELAQEILDLVGSKKSLQGQAGAQAGPAGPGGPGLKSAQAKTKSASDPAWGKGGRAYDGI